MNKSTGIMAAISIAAAVVGGIYIKNKFFAEKQSDVEEKKQETDIDLKTDTEDPILETDHDELYRTDETPVASTSERKVETPGKVDGEKDEKGVNLEYDPYKNVFKDGTFEVEVSFPADESLTSKVPDDFEEPSQTDAEVYVEVFNQLVESDRVIPFDPKWVVDGKLGGFETFDHRRHEKGFFASVSEDETTTVIIQVSRRGVVAFSLSAEKAVQWATSRHDLGTQYMEVMGEKERNRFERDWSNFHDGY